MILNIHGELTEVIIHTDPPIVDGCIEVEVGNRIFIMDENTTIEGIKKELEEELDYARKA